MNQNPDDDHIDKSLWLPDGVPMITPEREAKGDMRVERDIDTQGIRFAQSQVRNILNFIWEKNIIDDQQHHDGQTFQIWRDIHRTALGLRKPVSSGGDETLGVRLRAYGYVLLIQRLSLYDIRAIEQTIDTFLYSHTMWLAERNRRAYFGAFNRLSLNMPAIKDRIHYLEELSEEERNELSDGHLKKLLAELSKCR